MKFRAETSYDRYHANAKNIYRVVQEQPGNVYLGSNFFAVTPGPLAAALAAFAIAAAVIGFETYRAAAANPAGSMRYE